jgi:hypothetical protein
VLGANRRSRHNSRGRRICCNAVVNEVPLGRATALAQNQVYCRTTLVSVTTRYGFSCRDWP